MGFSSHASNKLFVPRHPFTTRLRNRSSLLLGSPRTDFLFHRGGAISTFKLASALSRLQNYLLRPPWSWDCLQPRILLQMLWPLRALIVVIVDQSELNQSYHNAGALHTKSRCHKKNKSIIRIGKLTCLRILHPPKVTMCLCVIHHRLNLQRKWENQQRAMQSCGHSLTPISLPCPYAGQVLEDIHECT